MHRCDPYNIEIFFNILLNLAAENIQWKLAEYWKQSSSKDEG